MPNGGIIARGGFPLQLSKAIDTMYCDAGDKVMTQWKEFLHEVAPSKGSSRVEAELSGLGGLDVVGENGIPEMDIPLEGWQSTRLYIKYGEGFIVTEEMRDDDFHGKIMAMASSLGTQTEQKPNTIGFALLSGGFDTYTTPDSGTPYVFSAAHYYLDTDEGAQSNLGTAALSETALQAVHEHFGGLTTHRGDPMPQKLKDVWVPLELEATALKLYKGSTVLGSADNDPLTTNPSFGMMSWKPKVGYYLSDANNWYALSDNHKASISFKKRADLRNKDDAATRSRVYFSTSRFQVFTNDWRGMYGANVT